ncbi:MAG: Fibronectin, type III domain protein [Parcubacteria group bacterium GW2011_GWF1_40_6]|nr:MAG: Fibronectin, type III domain protein [Parcubacteria group bacterium GW2011_GWF1_40_6]HLA29317.1 hypothetical protein [Syntrophales bacterium]
MAVDDFNRADSNDLGVNWTESDYSTPNSLRILNNRLRMGEANGIAHYNGTFADDQYVEATVTGMQFGDGQTGIAVRVSGSQGGFSAYAAILWPVSGRVRLYKYVSAWIVADAQVELANVPYTLLTDGVLQFSTVKIAAIGATIKVYIDSVEVISVSDNSIASGNPGLIARSSYWVELDDWTGQSLSYDITADAVTNGSITPAGVTSVVGGGSQMYAITPDSGYGIFDVLIDSVSVGAVSSYNFTNVAEAHTISATFGPLMGQRALLKIRPENCGHITINDNSPQYWFQHGDNIVIEPVPDAVYALKLYVSDFPDAALTTGEPDSLPDEFHSCIVDFACYALSMKLKKWKQAAKYYNIYVKNLTQRRKDYIDRKAEKRAIHQIPNNIKYGGTRQ